ARCYWPDVRPACKHNHFPELLSAIASVPKASVAKTQAESAMAIRLELMRPPVFVAPKTLPPKQTVIKRQDRSRKSPSSIQASQTVSENLTIINRLGVGR